MKFWKTTAEHFILLLAVTLLTACGDEESENTSTPTNTPPIANAQSVLMGADETTPITLSGSDADGDPLTYSIKTFPTHGVLSGGIPNVIYTPGPDYNNSDSFTFSVSDGTLESTEAVITIGSGIPNAPGNATALNGDRRVTLNWDEAPIAISYNLYWSTSAGTGKAGTRVTGISPPYYHDGLTNGTPYYYTLTAVNAMGESNVSDEITASPEDTLISSLAFDDAALSTCINATASKEGAVYVHDLTYLDCSGKNIASLDGIEQLNHLGELRLYNNSISDITPLAALNRLNILYLDSNHISDITPLAKLDELIVLDLYSNAISHINPLATLTGLEELDLYDNTINTISPLATLTNLTYLGLDNNIIRDVSPLAALVNLEDLFLNDNNIGGRNVGNIDDLVTLTAAFSIDLNDNPSISCSELQTLIDALSADVVDPGEATEGVTCTGP